MKSVEFVAPGCAAPGVAEEPVLREGEALIAIRAVGICGSDLHVFEHGHIGAAAAAYPFIPGHEAVGVVEEVAGEPGSPLVGQRVSIEPTISCRACEYCLQGSPNLCVNQRFPSLPPDPGLLRERVAHPAWLVEPVPAHLSDAAATLLEPMAVSVSAVDLLHARAGQPVAILGCGAIGLTCLLMARIVGLGPILCTDPVPHRRKAAQALGADVVATPEEAEGLAAGLAGAHGFPYVIEASGSADAQMQMARLAAPGARIAVIGTNMEDRVSIPGHMARRKGLTLLMVRRSRNTLTRTIRLAERPEVAATLERLVSHRLPPEEAQRAFETAATYGDGALKVVIEMGKG